MAARRFATTWTARPTPSCKARTSAATNTISPRQAGGGAANVSTATMVVDGGTSVRYYLHCQAATELQSPDIGLNNHNFSAVGWGSSADRWYGGEIDRLRIWSRALSEQELTQLCPKPKLTDDLELH